MTVTGGDGVDNDDICDDGPSSTVDDDLGAGSVALRSSPAIPIEHLDVARSPSADFGELVLVSALAEALKFSKASRIVLTSSTKQSSDDDDDNP